MNHHEEEKIFINTTAMYILSGALISEILDNVSIKLNVDQLLDQYNDYIRLYNMFGDKEYLDKAELTLLQLRQLN